MWNSRLQGVLPGVWQKVDALRCLPAYADGEYTDDCDYKTVEDTCKYNRNEEFQYLLFAGQQTSAKKCTAQLKSLCSRPPVR